MATQNNPETVIETDVLVIGGGMAACFAAVKAREQGVNVTLVSKEILADPACRHGHTAYLTVCRGARGSAT